MANVLLSALITLLIWLGLFIGFFGLLGYLIGSKFKTLVPQKQDHLPPHLLFWVPLILGLAIGAMNGLHVAAPEASLAVGDAIALQHIVIRSPWAPPPPYALADTTKIGWISTLTAAKEDMSTQRLIMTLIGKAMIGPALGPALSIKILIEAFNADRASNSSLPSSWTRVWWHARLKLEKLSRMTVWASLALASLYLISMALAALVLIASAKRDLPVRPKKARRRL